MNLSSSAVCSAAPASATPIRHADASRRPIVISVPGVDRDSPLGRGLAAALSGYAAVVLVSSSERRDGPWHRSLRGTALDWIGTPAASERVCGPDVVLDLHGSEPVQRQGTWRIVDGLGNSVLRPFSCLTAPRGTRSVISLFLIESEGPSAGWTQLAEAHISNRRRHRALLDAVGQTIAWLASTAVRARPLAVKPLTVVPHRPKVTDVLASRMGSAAARLRERTCDDIWAIARLAEPVEAFLTTRRVDPDYWIAVPAQDGFIADPFPWPTCSGALVCERYSHRTGIGSLEVLFPDSAEVTRTEPLDVNIRSHLSYPFTYAEGDTVLCLPEMLYERRQAIFVLEPGRPPRELCTVAENEGMADPTLFQHGGLYWIAYSNIDLGMHENLCLRFAARLEGPWRSHRLNPVKIDVRSSRPGGTPFHVGTELYRPAQDCSDHYGCAVVINRIVACDPEHYLEEPVARLTPSARSRYPDGMHTFSVTPEGIVVDGKRIVLDPRLLLQRLARRLSGLRYRNQRGNNPKLSL